MPIIEKLPSGRFRGGFRHPVTRKKVWHPGGPFDYQYEAEAWALVAEKRARDAAVQADFGEDRGSAPEAPPNPTRAAAAPARPARPAKWVGPTVAAYGEGWLARQAVAKNTRSSYVAHIKGLSIPVHDDQPGEVPVIGEVPMGLLTKSDVQRWQVASDKSGVGRPTINARLQRLRALYADLFDSDEYAEQADDVRDPTRGIRYLTEDAPDFHVVEADEEAALLAAAIRHDAETACAGSPVPHLAVAILVALEAGLRWEEVYGLRVCSVTGDYLTVSHVNEDGILRPYTKSKKSRIVPMTTRLATALAPVVTEARQRGGISAILFPATGSLARTRKPYRADLAAGRTLWHYDNHRKREWLPVLHAIGAARETYADTGRVRRDGTPILQRRLVEPVFGFHDLRHTYGSRLAAQGVPRSEIKELMGHADERTSGRYIHAGDDGRRLELVRAALDRRAA